MLLVVLRGHLGHPDHIDPPGWAFPLLAFDVPLPLQRRILLQRLLHDKGMVIYFM